MRNSIHVGKVGAWGLLDTKENLWLGEGPTGGPKTYDNEDMAIIAARMTDVQLGWASGRTKAKRYDGSATKIRDNVPVKMPARTALEKLESGRTL